MQKRKTSPLSAVVFRVLRGLIRLFYGRVEIEGLDRLPKGRIILVANHAQTNGPIVGELFLPDSCYIWCAGQMMDSQEVPGYAFKDFWSQKPKWTHPFYKILSYLITPLAVCLFNNARTIPVYRDTRVLSTFRESVQMLHEGRNILIFPEKDEKYNHILYRFETHFVDVAKLYYKRYHTNVTFVPMYIAPRLRKAYIGEGILYNDLNGAAEERDRIVTYLANKITAMAQALPEHVVVPYRNIPKKHYLTNKDTTEVPQ